MNYDVKSPEHAVWLKTLKPGDEVESYYGVSKTWERVTLTEVRHGDFDTNAGLYVDKNGWNPGRSIRPIQTKELVDFKLMLNPDKTMTVDGVKYVPATVLAERDAEIAQLREQLREVTATGAVPPSHMGMLTVHTGITSKHGR